MPEEVKSKLSELIFPGDNVTGGVSTWLPIARDGCYGFIGPVPSAVLDKLLHVFREDKDNILSPEAFVKNLVKES
jgi:hypothetical protein